MDIKTAYSIGDRVWIIADNTPIEVIVESVAALMKGNQDSAVTYVGRQCSAKSYRTVYKDIPESRVFNSKYALLMSLFASEGDT